MEIFTKNPKNGDSIRFNNNIYFYYEFTNTWYILGSTPDSVDPSSYIIAQDSDQSIVFVTTYNDYVKYQQWKLVDLEVQKRLKIIDSLTNDYNASNSFVKNNKPDYLAELQNLKIQLQAVFQQSDPDNIIWPPMYI